MKTFGYLMLMNFAALGLFAISAIAAPQFGLEPITYAEALTFIMVAAVAELMTYEDKRP